MQDKSPARQILNSVGLCSTLSAGYGKIWAPKGLGRPNPKSTAGCRSHGHSLGLATLSACDFPQQVVYIPGISNVLGCPLFLWLCSHSFVHGPLKSILTVWPSRLSSETWVKASLILQLLHVHKTSNMRVMPRPATSSSSGLVSWTKTAEASECLGVCTWGNTSLCNLKEESGLEHSSQSKVLQRSLTFSTPESTVSGTWSVSERTSGNLSDCPVLSGWLPFNANFLGSTFCSIHIL